MSDAEEKDRVQFRQYIDNRIDEIAAKHLGQLDRRLEALESHTKGMGQHFAKLLSDTEELRNQIGSQYAALAHATSEDIGKLREDSESRLKDHASRLDAIAERFGLYDRWFSNVDHRLHVLEKGLESEKNIRGQNVDDLGVRIDGVNEILSQRLATVEIRTLELDARVVDNRGFVRNPFFVKREAERLDELDRRLAALESHRTPAHREVAQENLRLWGELNNASEAAEAFQRIVEWFAIPRAESFRAGRLAAMMMQQVADLRAENVRLQKELDELLGTEFFKVGEKLRKADSAKDAEISRLAALLGDPRATGREVAELLDRVEHELMVGRAGALHKFCAGLLDSGAQSYFADRYGHTVEHLLRWLHEVRGAAAKHLSPTSTEE